MSDSQKLEEFAVIDADSQSTYRLFPTAAGATCLHRNHDCLLADRRLRFAHSIFVERHNLFPLSARDVSNVLFAEIAQDFEGKVGRFFGEEAISAVLYPAESTIEGLARNLWKRPRLTAAPLLALHPAFRRFDEAQFRPDQNIEWQPNSETPLNVVFIDDSYSTGDSEMRAMNAVASFTGKRPLKWLTYALVARDSLTVEASYGESHPRPGQVRSMRLPRSSRAGTKDYGFNYFVALGPESLGPSECPLCSAFARAHEALIWAEAATPRVRNKLSNCVEKLRARHLESGHADAILASTEIERLFVGYHAWPLAAACTRLNQYPPASADEAVAEMLFLSVNYRDALAFVPRYYLSDSFTRVAKLLKNDDDALSEYLLLAASFVPNGILLDLHAGALGALLAIDAVDTIAALNAILVSSSAHHAELLGEADHVSPATVEIVRRKASKMVETGIRAFFAKAPNPEQLHAYLAALAIMADRPKLEDEFWLARTLSLTLEGGQHTTFYKYMLEEGDLDLALVRQSMLQCLDFIKRLHVATLSPNAAKMEAAIAEVRVSTDLKVVRAASYNAINEFWDNGYREEFVYNDGDILQVVAKSRENVMSRAAKAGIRCDPFKLLRPTGYRGGWRFLAPFDTILLKHFDNLWENTLKHFYQSKAQSPAEHYERLAADKAFHGGGPVARVTLCIYQASPNQEHYAVVFSDRCKAPPADALSVPGGLSSGRVHLEAKRGGLDYFASQKLPPWLKAELAAASTDTAIFNNHYVTYFPILNKDREATILHTVS